jgi:hypothetical protein
MKKLLSLLLFSIPLLSFTQNYSTCAGFRGGESWGFTYRFYNDENNATEALLSFRNGGMQLTAMKEEFSPVLLNYSSHFFLYKGYGGHLGYTRWLHDDYNHFTNEFWYHTKASPVLGIDGLIGLEYCLFKYPFTCGLEFKPFAEVGGRRFFKLNLWDFALTFKYTFNK